MQAYYVYDEKKDADVMVIPEMGCMLDVNRHMMTNFISVKPDFSQWQGQDLNGLPPEAMGVVVATRNEDGDVCILEMSLWHERMAFHLGQPK